MAMMRLEPSIPMMCPKGKGRALIMLDYSEDHHLMWVIALDATGQLWTYKNTLVRVLGNETLGTKCETIKEDA